MTNLFAEMTDMSLRGAIATNVFAMTKYMDNQQKPNSKKIMMDIAAPVPKKDFGEDSNNDFSQDYQRAQNHSISQDTDQNQKVEVKRIKKEKEIELLINKKSKKFFPQIFFWMLAAIILSSAAYIIFSFLPKADIKIIIKKSSWNYNDTVTAVKGLTDINISDKQIPVEIFSQTKNVVEYAPASSKKNVQNYANGEITIYNDYNANPQILIKGTRFAAPDGKIFKLTKTVAIPGFSSIQTHVVAAQPGTDYNIAPVSKFTIPGLASSSRYNSIYGKSETAMVGGAIGNIANPSEDDVKNLKAKAEADLSSSTAALINSQIPDGYKVLSSAQQFNIAQETIGNVDDKGNFSIAVEGKMLTAAFKESDVLRLMQALAKQSLGPNFEEKQSQFNYGVGQFDKNNNFSFMMNYQGIYWQPFDVNKFKNSILGKGETELKTTVSLTSNIEKTNIAFWPFWVDSVPTNEKRINVNVE